MFSLILYDCSSFVIVVRHKCGEEKSYVQLRDHMKLEVDASTAADSAGIQTKACQLWANSYHYGLSLWEKLILPKNLLIDFRINLRAPLESNHSPYPLWSFSYIFHSLKKITWSLCKLPGIMLLPMWTFSALNSPGLCKKTNLSNATSLPDMQVKTYSQSTVFIIRPSSIWEISRYAEKFCNIVTMSQRQP